MRESLRRVVCEGDNERVVLTIQNENKKIRSYLGELIREICFVQSCFDTCQIRSIPRRCNLAAHIMAQAAHSDPKRVWIEEVPQQLNEVYFHDLIN